MLRPPRAALLSQRIVLVAAVGAAVALSAAPAAPERAGGAALPQPLWVLELDGKGAVGSATLRSYRTQGFDAVLTEPRRLTARRSASVRRGAAGARLLHLRARAAKPAACPAVKRRDRRCVLAAPTLAAARRLARSSADLVVVHLRSLRALRVLRGRPRGRILALARLDGKRYDTGAWTNAVAAAVADPRLDLGVSAVGSRRRLAVRRFGAILRGLDQEAPAPPRPPPPAPPPPQPPASVFMSPSGADASPCTQAQPCRTFNRAYRVAASGATVEVAAGSYAGETISSDASKTSAADVIFRPAIGAAVIVTGRLLVQADHFELRNMTVRQVEFVRSADDVTLRSVVNHGFWMQGPSNISFIGGEVSCGFCPYHPHLTNGGADASPPRNILFDGVYFHDWHSVNGEHTECLQILGGDGLTIRNSIFRNCATGNGGIGATGSLFIGWLGGNGPVTKNVLIENTFFYPSGNPYAIQMSDLANLDLRYNSISQPIIIFDREGPGAGMDLVGNIMGKGSCTAESSGVPINWRHNVMQGGTCGATDRNAAAGFIDRNNNLHLGAGAPAINSGDPGSHPSHDIDGQARPGGSAPDAGADEAG